MDDLANDLTNAIVESPNLREGNLKKTKSWKYRSKPKCSIVLGSSLPKSSARSDDSDSSYEHWSQQWKDVSTNGSHYQTDSDLNEINQKKNHLSWRGCNTTMAESDSVNENLHPSYERRRKRKFKRMAVDPPSMNEHTFSALPTSSLFSQKNRRMRNIKMKLSKLSLKCHKVSKITTVSELSSKMENICKEFGNSAASSGKRKRCAHERNTESNGCGCKEFISNKGASNLFMPKSCQHIRYAANNQDIYSSGLSSSSESECGVIANEESREADDEQSDFYPEMGPTSGISNFSPWWEKDNILCDEDQLNDLQFQAILGESFKDMSEASKMMYAMHIDEYKDGRQIKSGRRRLGNNTYIESTTDNLPCAPIIADDASLSVENYFLKTMPNEKKKRKGMTSISNSVYAFGDDALFKTTGSQEFAFANIVDHFETSPSFYSKMSSQAP